MAKNRQEVPRQERTGELVSAATELFLRHGYRGTTMAAISSAAGVAPANVYWYFPSKDDIFAAVMDRVLRREARALEHELRDADALTALVRGLSDMRAFRGLHSAMHSRMPVSAAVRESHEEFLTWIRENVFRALDERTGVTDRDMIGDVIVSLFEGANVSGSHARPARDMIMVVFEALVDEQARRGAAAPQAQYRSVRVTSV